MSFKQIKTELPLVAIIGRTNVGKSTLFNRLVGARLALVSRLAGTTRDRRFGVCDWNKQRFNVIDTAGLDVSGEKEIDRLSIEQAKKSIEEADLVLFVVDGRDGLLPQDRAFAKAIMKSKKTAIVAVNKIDSRKLLNRADEFYKLGFKDVFAISAKTGAGTGDLLDCVLNKLNQPSDKEKQQLSAFVRVSPQPSALIQISPRQSVSVAIIGKPNVGKSSLFNKIVGEERAIVSPVPHTTRDSQDTTIEIVRNDKNYYLTFIDTAGIIKHRKIKDPIKAQSIEQSLAAIAKCDIALLVIDAAEPITEQDKNLANEILKQNKSLIFVVNKWDIYREKVRSSKFEARIADIDKEYTSYLHRHFPFLTWAPIIFISAKTGAKIERLVNSIIEIFETQYREITPEQLNEFKRFFLRKKQPPRAANFKSPYIREIKQRGAAPLTFEIIAAHADNIVFPYRRFIMNELRNYFNFVGCGIKLILTEKR